MTKKGLNHIAKRKKVVNVSNYFGLKKRVTIKEGVLGPFGSGSVAEYSLPDMTKCTELRVSGLCMKYGTIYQNGGGPESEKGGVF